MGKGYYFLDCDAEVSEKGCKPGFELIPSGNTLCCKKRDDFDSFSSNLFLESGESKFIKSDNFKGEIKGNKGLGYYQEIDSNRLNSSLNLKSAKKPIFIS